MECRGIVEASWQTPDLPSEVGSVLNKIEECGRRLKSWNMKKRGELRADLRRKREAVIAASKGNGRLNWRTIGVLKISLMRFRDPETSKQCRHEMALDANGRKLLVTSSSVRAPIYQVRGNTNGLKTLPHSAAITTVDWHPTLPVFLTGSADNSVRVTSIL
ncbi:hypothetical protein LWI28_000882 [Acer negundo]|uniref:Uncharacterized protein n=1 Tax=Acer negundo TaxID=4023 RepID=A0AAD5ICJ7_ACENE|nr:hypothetical protein LWI28_000882 [Acer negundo]